MGLAIALLFAGSLMELAGPLVTKMALDRAVPERDLGLLAWLVAAYAGSLVLAFEPLVLVLDGATSSVDPELEAQIEEALRELMQGRTALVIPHRLSTVVGADQILVLHHGEIRERGTHAELLRRGGLYARLHEVQFVRADADEAPRHRDDGAVADRP